jgi:hypothetical protein
MKTDPVLERLKKEHPNSTVTAKYPKKGPSWAKKESPKYSIRDRSGHRVSVSPGVKSNEKSYTTKEIVSNMFNNKK